MGFVDIHSHIMPGVDDGARTVEDSLAMIDVARRSGTTDIVASPHANGEYVFDGANVDRWVADVNGQVEGLRVYPGCDFHLQVDNIEAAIADPARFAINHRCYVLVEFPHLNIFSTADEIFRRLMDAGMYPIITHPERNPQLQQTLDDIERWVQSGCFVQVTAGSYLGVFGKKPRACARELLERGLTHFVASDAHDCEFRNPSLREAYDALAREWGEDTIRPLFVENPRAAVNGDPIEFDVMPAGVKARKWYRFW